MHWVVTCEPKLPFTHTPMKAAHFGPGIIKGDLYLQSLQTPKDTAKPVPGYRALPTASLVQLESKCYFPTFFFPCSSCILQKKSSLLLLPRDPGRALSNFTVSHEMMESNEKLHSALSPIFHSACSTPVISCNYSEQSWPFTLDQKLGEFMQDMETNISRAPSQAEGNSIPHLSSAVCWTSSLLILAPDSSRKPQIMALPELILLILL